MAIWQCVTCRRTFHSEGKIPKIALSEEYSRLECCDCEKKGKVKSISQTYYLMPSVLDVILEIRCYETSWKGDYRSGPGIQPILYT